MMAATGLAWADAGTNVLASKVDVACTGSALTADCQQHRAWTLLAPTATAQPPPHTRDAPEVRARRAARKVTAFPFGCLRRGGEEVHAWVVGIDHVAAQQPQPRSSARRIRHRPCLSVPCQSQVFLELISAIVMAADYLMGHPLCIWLCLLGSQEPWSHAHDDTLPRTPPVLLAAMLPPWSTGQGQDS